MATDSKSSKREREREDLFKIQQERESRSYSKSSKREREDLFKIQQERAMAASASSDLDTGPDAPSCELYRATAVRFRGEMT